MYHPPKPFHRGAVLVTSNNVADKIRAYDANDRKPDGHGRSHIRKWLSVDSLASPSKDADGEPLPLHTSSIHTYKREINKPRRRSGIDMAGYEAFGKDGKFIAQENRLKEPFGNNGKHKASLQNLAYLSTGSVQSLSSVTFASTEQRSYVNLNNSKMNKMAENPPTPDNMSHKTATPVARVKKQRPISIGSFPALDELPEDQSTNDEALPIATKEDGKKPLLHSKGMSKSDFHIDARRNFEFDQRRSLSVSTMKDSTVIFEAAHCRSTGALSCMSAQSNNYYERKNIIDSTSETLEAYRQDDNKCDNGLDHLVLERFRNAKSKLDDTGLLIIKCTEKDGSSDLGKCLLLAYKNTTQCIVGNISEYTTCITGGHGPYLIMIDDAFGATEFEGQQVNSWLTNIERHSTQRTNGSLKLIFVLKHKNVPYCQEFLKRYEKCVIDLSDLNNQLKNDEKQYLLKRCINRKNSQRKRKKIVLSKQTVECIGKTSVSSGFFGMVELFLSKKSNTDQGKTFFDKPSAKFYKHICGLRESNDESQQTMYLSLAALCLFDGLISTDDIAVLSRWSYYDFTNVKRNAKSSVELLNCSRNTKRGNKNAHQPHIQIAAYKCLVDLASDMNFKSNIGMHINDGMKHLLGTFVQKEYNCYTFSNQSIETAIYVSIGQHFPEVVIKYSKKSFFQEYVGTDMSFEVLENRCIRIDLRNRDLCMIAFERLRQALRERDCQSFVSHPLMKDARFLSIVSENWDTLYDKIFSFFNKKKPFLETIVSTQDIVTGQNSLILSLNHPFYEHSSRPECHYLGDWVLKHPNWKDIRKENTALAVTEQIIMMRCCSENLEDVYMSLVESVSISTIAKHCLDGAIRSGSLNIVKDVLTASKLSTEEYALALEEATSCYANDKQTHRLDILLELGKYSDKTLLLTSIGKSGNYNMLTVVITIFEIDINELITVHGPLLFLLTLHNHWTLFGVAIDHFSADPNLIFKGHMCVHLAAECSRLRILQILFKENAHLIHEKDKLGRTPIHLASMKGHKSCVLFLLQNSAAINATDKSGQTALHKAACLTGTEVTHLLIANGADINIKDKNSLTAIDVAKRYRNDENVRKLTGAPRIKNEPHQLNHNVLAALFN